jgi:hypothetical protein
VQGVVILEINKVRKISLNPPDTFARLPHLGTSAALGALVSANWVGSIDADGESNEQTTDIILFLPHNEALIAVASAFDNASADPLRIVLKYHAIQDSVVFASNITDSSVETVWGVV